MSVFELYDTGGNLVAPDDTAVTATHQSLVRSLVDSSFIDVYYDPRNHCLAHRFRAQYRRKGRAYRWQDFYAVYQTDSYSGPQLVSAFARQIRGVFEDDRWEPYHSSTPLEDDADPRYIDRLLAHADGGSIRVPGVEQDLYETLCTKESSLEIGMSTHQKAIELLGVLLECDAPIIVGSNVDRSRIENSGLIIEYGPHDDFEPLTARTRRLLARTTESTSTQGAPLSTDIVHAINDAIHVFEATVEDIRPTAGVSEAVVRNHLRKAFLAATTAQSDTHPSIRQYRFMHLSPSYLLIGLIGSILVLALLLLFVGVVIPELPCILSNPARSVLSVLLASMYGSPLVVLH